MQLPIRSEANRGIAKSRKFGRDSESFVADQKNHVFAIFLLFRIVLFYWNIFCGSEKSQFLAWQPAGHDWPIFWKIEINQLFKIIIENGNETTKIKTFFEKIKLSPKNWIVYYFYFSKMIIINYTYPLKQNNPTSFVSVLSILMLEKLTCFNVLPSWCGKMLNRFYTSDITNLKVVYTEDILTYLLNLQICDRKQKRLLS